LWRKNITNIRPGLSVGIFLVAMFTARFLIEFLKIPQEKFNNTSLLDMGQWLSIPFILLGIAFIIYSFKTKSLSASASASGTNSNEPQDTPGK